MSEVVLPGTWFEIQVEELDQYPADAVSNTAQKPGMQKTIAKKKAGIILIFQVTNIFNVAI